MFYCCLLVGTGLKNVVFSFPIEFSISLLFLSMNENGVYGLDWMNVFLLGSLTTFIKWFD